MKKVLYIFFLMAMFVSLDFAYGSCPAGSKPRKEKKDTLAIITDKASKGDAVAQNLLGTWYYQGKKVKQDYKAALGWFSKSAKQNNADAIGNMAMCYQYGNGIKKDTVMAMKLYQSAMKRGNQKVIVEQDAKAQAGDLFAARLLMDCYMNGHGVKRDLKKAQAYQLILAKAGDTEQQFQYALACLNGKRPSEAATWFKAASKSGMREAIYYYGYLLFNGMGVSQDKAQGLRLMDQAAAKGMVAGYYQVGRAYYEGNGVAKDLAKAKQRLAKAAGVNKDAAWYLGLCCLEGDTVDFYHAAQWLAEAAQKHEDELAALLAAPKYKNFQDYLLGLKKLYVEKDFARALALFKAVEKDGSAEGLTMQAVCMASQAYPKHSSKKAVKLLQKAITKGSHSAEYHLSLMCETGDGMKQPDKAKAIELLKAAAAGGIAEAQCKLGDLYFDGNGVARDLVQAAALYLQAEAQNRLEVASAKKLITCYEHGVTSIPDLGNAAKRIEDLKKTKPSTALLSLLQAIKE